MSKKLKYTIKVCLYWTSIILPVYDIITGTVSAIRTLIDEAKRQRDEKLKQQKEQEQYERFYNDN